MKKAANEVDRHVGGRVRMRRMMIGMSQEKLGAALGLTFQQVQKYEKGTNRISASRLQQMSGALGVAIDYFYDGLAQPEGQAGGFAEAAPARGYEAADVLTTDGWKLVRSYQRIRDPKTRRKLLDLVAAIAGSEDDAPEPRSE